MGKNYDNWERLVRAVLLRERYRELCLLSSPSSSSSSSTCSTSNLRSRTSRKGSELPVQVSDLEMEQRGWKMMLQLDKQNVAWKSEFMRFSVDKQTGKNCIMLGARQLLFSRHSSVEWVRSHPTSRFTDSAKINSSYMFLRGSIKEDMLSPETFYAAYLVFRLTKNTTSIGKNISAAIAVKSVKPRCKLLLRPKDSKEALAINIQQVEGRNGVVAVPRDDGLNEIEIRIRRRDNGDVEARLLKIDKTRGLIVEGIEFRPKTPVEFEGEKTGKVNGLFSRSTESSLNV